MRQLTADWMIRCCTLMVPPGGWCLGVSLPCFGLVTKASAVGVFLRDQLELNALLRSLACKEFYT